MTAADQTKKATDLRWLQYHHYCALEYTTHSGTQPTLEGAVFQGPFDFQHVGPKRTAIPKYLGLAGNNAAGVWGSKDIGYTVVKPGIMHNGHYDDSFTIIFKRIGDS